MASTKEATKDVLSALRHIDDNVTEMKKEILQLQVGKAPDRNVAMRQIAGALWDSNGLISFPVDAETLPTSRPTTPAPDVKALRQQTTTAILRNLRFDEMSDREERIPPVYPDTFAWMFQIEARLGANRVLTSQDPGFYRWLQSQESTIFWINGIPASGKSTLMKYISKHESLTHGLRTWASGSRLHIATFYFWGPGSSIQKSRNGLLRTLLHQLLSQRPELTGVVAPRRRIFFEYAGPDMQQSPGWEWPELCECFYRFASYARQTDSRIALFIDGLDEYNGDSQELVSFLIKLHREYDLKICVSSRPWNVFNDAFRKSPSLAMERLTQPDIDIYVEQKLGNSPAMDDIRAVMPTEVDQLLHEIKAKAKGVFLWVVLVVEQLLVTSRETPRFDSIRKVFDSLPGELEALYNTIQSQIGPEKQQINSQLYRLVMEWKRTWNGQMPTTFLWLAINSADFTKPLKYPDSEQALGIGRLTERLVNGHTRGILHVSKNHHDDEHVYAVDFLHRTAFDWLRQENNWSKICKQSGANYDPMLGIVRALVSQVNSMVADTRLERDMKSYFPVEGLCRIFLLASEVADTPHGRAELVRTLDELNPQQFEKVETIAGFYTDDYRPMDVSEMIVVKWAATWTCNTYLNGILDARRSSRSRKKSNIFSRSWKSPLDPILTLAILGFGLFSVDPSSFMYQLANSSRSSNWLASKRLDTIELLIQRGAKLSSNHMKSMKIMQQKGGFGVNDSLASLLSKARSDRDPLGSIKEARLTTFDPRLVDADHTLYEFPNYRLAENWKIRVHPVLSHGNP